MASFGCSSINLSLNSLMLFWSRLVEFSRLSASRMDYDGDLFSEPIEREVSGLLRSMEMAEEERIVRIISLTCESAMSLYA